MDELIAKLEEDHRRLTHVILKLVGELETCHNAAFYNTRFVKHFTDELTYIHEYPAYINHPLENRIYRKLLEKDVPDREVVEHAIAEHDMLEARTSTILHQLRQLMSEKTAPPADLLKETQTLLKLQLEHHEMEARSVLPLIRQHLKASEVNDIRYKMMELPRTAAMRQHFGSLYNNIVNRRATG